MPKQNTLARSLHDVGLAAWFGGSLMGAVGLNGATAAIRDRHDRTRTADAGWAAWTPVNAAAIGAYVLGSIKLTTANKSRLAGQQGVATTAAVKTGLTVAALGVTAAARLAGQKIMDATAAAEQEGSAMPSEDATTPAPDTAPEVAAAQRQEKWLQWAVPALTGAAIVANAKMGEQQRPRAVARGLLQRINPRD